MKEFKSVNDILDFAIANEEEAEKFYLEMSKKAPGGMREGFVSLSKEEAGHKKKLLAVKEGNKLLSSEGKVLDLKIGDYLVDVNPTADMNYLEVLITVMKKEKAAYKLYTNLADNADTPELKDLFLGLAQEEAKHKLRFEVEYDDEIYKEN